MEAKISKPVTERWQSIVQQDRARQKEKLSAEKLAYQEEVFRTAGAALSREPSLSSTSEEIGEEVPGGSTTVSKSSIGLCTQPSERSRLPMSRRLDELRTEINEKEVAIRSLENDLNQSREEVAALRQQRQSASDAYTTASFQRDGKNVEEHRCRELQLMDAVRQKDILIRELESSLEAEIQAKLELRRKLRQTEQDLEDLESATAVSKSQHVKPGKQASKDFEKRTNGVEVIRSSGRQGLELRGKKANLTSTTMAVYKTMKG
ncbi:hypothetical protein LTR09_012842 [Extremus antarcticus]|uniref:Uncharacterized protein n=1 Tax=Extremus antarcticus TaxID=702011 RepID=A0AAJ0D9D2_9PEZI|nr:hypothetical protein LTR09_012842 [Extremus antarcticus]